MKELIFPKQYSNVVEEVIINQSLWHTFSIPEVMVNDKNIQGSDNLYQLFFPIFSETSLKNKMKYESYTTYLINHSKEPETISLSCTKSPKIVYFANSSDSRLIIKNISIDLIDKKGKSLFIDENEKISITRSTNTQTCLVILELKSITNKQIEYQ